ncbi:MAG: PQQ-like beta-propeller repeat protein [Verrucomicrobia bacterium]|nr:PQQ-like beta-propeller repeat protein [Verrucomicrobiota bacterium]
MSKLFFRLALAGFFVVGAQVVSGDDWPQWLGPQRDGVWRETGIIEKFPPGGPTVRWRAPIGAGYAGPAVAGGKVFITDRRLAQGASNQGNPFERGSVQGAERVLCLSEADGRILWQHEYPCHYTISYPAGPRCTPVVADGKVFTLGAQGDLLCLDATNGKVIWSKDLKREYQTRAPMWGFAAHPLLDGRKLICLAGGAGSVAVAFDKDTGKELWKSLTAEEIGYCPPMLYEAGGQRQLVVWHPESVNALNPETGQRYWTVPFTSRVGLSVSTPRKLGDRLFITAFYDGSLMLQLDAAKPAATVLWQSKKRSERETTELHSIISTPFFEDGHIYGVCSYGQLRCLNADTGERLWETFAATTGKEVRWGNAFLVKNGNRFFLFNELGDLIIARLSPKGYEEVSRAHILDPTNKDPGRPVLWSHPAFANRCVYARNDKEIVCVSVAKSP